VVQDEDNGDQLNQILLSSKRVARALANICHVKTVGGSVYRYDRQKLLEWATEKFKLIRQHLTESHVHTNRDRLIQ